MYVGDFGNWRMRYRLNEGDLYLYYLADEFERSLEEHYHGVRLNLQDGRGYIGLIYSTWTN